MESHTTYSSEPRSAGLPLPYDHQQLADAAYLLAQALSLRFKHKSFGMDIKPLAKLPLSLSS